MAVSQTNIQRDGLDRLTRLAKALCTVTAAFSAILLRKYPNNALIAELLAAIATICALIPDVEATFLSDMPNAPELSDDPLSTAGINGSLAPAEPPV